MRRALRLGGLAIAASVLVGAAPVQAQLVRIVDQDIVHYTNEPCQPRYVRLIRLREAGRDAGRPPATSGGPEERTEPRRSVENTR